MTRETRKTVKVVTRAGHREVPVEEVSPGDLVRVPCGEMIPVDGEIAEGSASVDESVVTGEPFAVHKASGDRVLAGAVAVSAPLTVKADKQGDKGFVYVLAREMEKSLKIKPEIHRKADIIVQFFISGVVVYALGVFGVTVWITGDATAGLMRMAAVTAIACPCAWALSVPTAFAAAIGGLSRCGILVRGGQPLELAGRVKQVVLDKTGTLTLSRPLVAGIYSPGMDENEMLRVAAAVESGFNHPVARAVETAARERGLKLPQALRSEDIPGQGVKAEVLGHEVVIGSSELFQDLSIPVAWEFFIEGKGVWVALDHETAGVIEIQDRLREDTLGLGGRLRTIGVEQVTLATGDSDEAEARRVAKEVGADDWQWGLKPHEKQALVRQVKTRGITLMAGDGVNDSISLAEADVGVSMGHTKADLAIQSSDIIVLREDVSALATVIKMGKCLSRTINQNYAWAIAFNTLGIALATAGVLSPWLAALFHHGSSVFVVANSARLVK